MKTRILVAALFCIAGLTQAADFDTEPHLLISPNQLSLSSPDLNPVLYEDVLKISAGAAFLCFELIGFPILQKSVFWKKPPSTYKPFALGENEPYLMDKSLHFTGAGIITEINYHVMKSCFGFEDPILAAGLTSLAFWTIMEYFDGIASNGFSVNDQISNSLGAAFGMLKLKYPSFPVYVRMGIDDLRRTLNWAQAGFDLKKFGTDYYSMLKTEMIYVFDNNLYVGVALSKGEGKDNYKNRFGISVGYDLLNGIDDKGSSVIHKILGFAHRHAAISISATYWNR
ncbi:MAG: YfiM family protein [Chitinispirillales bacterium]|jgi:hypothetical protein|nr:YfiM family protein [Chitinispirillales bacterium]